MAPFYSSVPVSQDSVTVSQHAQHQDPEPDAAKWYSAIIKFIIHTRTFSTVTRNVFCEKRLFSHPPTLISFIYSLII